MMYLSCDGQLTIVSGSPVCNGNWIAVTDTQLLSEALATRLMSRDDFFELSSYVVAIFVAAISIRLLLRSLTQEVSREQN